MIPRRIATYLLALVVVASAVPVGAGEDRAGNDPGGRGPADDMVLIPAGEFWMGARDDDRAASRDEKPRHRVHVDAFLIDRTEVTYERYQQFLTAAAETGGHAACHPAEPETEVHTPETHRVDILALDRPVVGVDWFDAYAFCKWAGKRLPTEAEWERAARGDEDRVYPWGDDWAPGRANASGSEDGFADIAPVGSFPEGASPFGVLDMSGNVWEWVGDAYETHYYDVSPARNPNGPHWRSLGFMVVRGGSWIDDPRDLRTSNREKRIRYAPTRRYDYVGIRCAKGVGS